MPFEIPWPGEERIYLYYSPTDLGPDFDTLQIVIDDWVAETVTIPIRGEGVSTASQTDVFQQPDNPMADILFVVDNSGSMEDNQTNLANNFTSFIQAATDWNADYQIGVTTTDVHEDINCMPPHVPCNHGAMGKLVSINGRNPGREVPLANGTFRIGRDRDCQLRPTSGAISPRHCEFAVSPEGVRVRDLMSRSGTFVNGSRIRCDDCQQTQI